MEKAGEVLFETQYHSIWSPISSRLPPSDQASPSGGSNFVSRLSLQGLSLRQLKENWSRSKFPRSINKEISLFISTNGEHVAIAVRNQIAIMRKEDNYMNPCGMFMSKDPYCVFVHGAWFEPWGVLGVVDQTDRIFLIKSNGQDIATATASQLKLSSPVVGLAVLDILVSDESCLYSLSLCTTEGLLHYVKVTQDLSSGRFHISKLNSKQILRQPSSNVSCLDYFPGHSLLVVAVSLAGNRNDRGNYSLFLYRVNKNSDLEFVSSTCQIEGLFSIPRNYNSHLTVPKVVFSSKGSYIATLDLTGRVNFFSIKFDPYSLSLITFDERIMQQVLGPGVNDDISWWSDHIAVISKKNGSITMFNIHSGMKSLAEDVQFHAPVLGRVSSCEGFTFVLEETEEIDAEGSSPKSCWSLISLKERSVPEMYNILITSQRFKAAVDFADAYGMDKDEVFKSQWLHSDQGVNEIKSSLEKVKDQMFVLSECVKGGKSEDAVRGLISYGLVITDGYRFGDIEDEQASSVWKFRKMRLKLLQRKERLETFTGINTGRFSAQEFKKFCSSPLHSSAISLAENGKIGALNLLFKRHPYSISVHALEILSVIPETIHASSYGQLLPGKPPPGMILRDEDWVEDEKMTSYFKNLPYGYDEIISLGTEVILKHYQGFICRQADELSEWYKNRARDIDSFSGQTDNSLSLIDIGLRKGIVDLEKFHEDLSYLNKLIYSTDEEATLSMSLLSWETLPDYEKFKLMLSGTKEETVVKRLREIALPFMRKRSQTDKSFLACWLKEMATENLMEVCLVVIEEGCKDVQSGGFFRDEVEVMEVTVDCVYLCTLTDKWSILASMLSKVQNLVQKEKDFVPKHSKSALTGLESGHDEDPSTDGTDTVRKKVKIAEGHVEVGRLLTHYQVPRPMMFFLDPQLDEKHVKQLLRLIMTKFGRRQPSKSDSDWASMWRDMQCFQEKAFHFLEPEYVLVEFCRGLLKAGKFSLARNYLKGTASTSLAPDKAENLVIQAAREYFFSASSISCTEIWKARECLSLLPSSDSVKAEVAVIDALTIKLPSLGVDLLPVQYKQVRDPMEIINMVIKGQPGAYLNLDEVLETARLLGLTSEDDIASIQEAAAREAAVSGDLQFAFDICYLLSKKGHGPIWDLCATIARGPAHHNMDISARRQLLGFSISHCDDDSLGELLRAWKEIDMQVHCNKLMALTGTSPVSISQQLDNIKHTLENIVKESGSALPCSLAQNGKLLNFATQYLPWLFELTRGEEGNCGVSDNSLSEGWAMSVKMQAASCLLSWLAVNEMAPKDDLIACLAKSAMESCVNGQGDEIGCSFLLNLSDDVRGAEIIEEQISTRKGYRELSSIMNMGMTYSSLQSAAVGCLDPEQRKILLMNKYKEKHASLSKGETESMDEAQSSFWKSWKLKLEEKRELTDRGRQIEQLIPGVDSSRFLSGDTSYIEEVILSYADSTKLKKAHILKSSIDIADTYGVQRSKVLLRFLACALVSEHWSNDEILAELMDYREDVVASAKGVISVISSVVYPQLKGTDKERLSYIYSLLCACCRHLKQTGDQSPIADYSENSQNPLDITQYLKLLEQECKRVSFIKDLNFKNISGLGGLNVDGLNQEVCRRISDSSVRVLAEMVINLLEAAPGPQKESIITWQSVYKRHVLGHLEALQSKSLCLKDIEADYNACRAFIKELGREDKLETIGSFRMLLLSLDESPSKSLILSLLSFWFRLARDIEELLTSEACLQTLISLIDADEIPVDQAWRTVSIYGELLLSSGGADEILNLFKALAFSGCKFREISLAFSVEEEFSLSQLYARSIDSMVLNFAPGSDDGKNMVNLLSSLSDTTCIDIEILNRVRQGVWDKLAAFSDDLRIPSQTRVFVLQMMECITGKNDRNMKPWEGWKYLREETQNQEDGSSRVATTLVALKSTQLLSSVSPGKEISPEDMMSVDSAVFCFLRLAKAVDLEAHLNTLQCILEEWEEFFSPKESNIITDDWGEGWEELTIQEEEAALSLSPLHSCWMLIVTKLIEISQFRAVIELLDRSLSKPHGTLLLEEETQRLIQQVDERDCFTGLKIAFLLPYKALWLESLRKIEGKLKQEDSLAKGSYDEELFSLALASGILPTIAADPSYQCVFAFFCRSAGLLSRVSQEAMARGRERESAFSLFGRLLFPLFVSELAAAGQLLLAGFMVSWWMHTHPSFSFVGTVDVGLRRYLGMQSQRLSQLSNTGDRELGSCKSLAFTVSNLWAKLGHSIQSALSILSSGSVEDMKLEN